MDKLKPFLILAVGALVIYEVYKHLAAYLAGSDPSAQAAAAAAAAAAAQAAARQSAWNAICEPQADACAAKPAEPGISKFTWSPRGTPDPNWDGHSTPGTCGTCVPVITAAAFGGCPDRLSCEGEPQGGYSGPAYTPTPPSTGPITIAPGSQGCQSGGLASFGDPNCH